MIVRSKTLIVLLAAVTSGGQGCGLETPEVAPASAAITNGTVAETDPEVVALVAGAHIFCTATLVAPNIVVTAGHCIGNRNARVFVGSALEDGGQWRDVVDQRANPEFDARTLAHDIGVLRFGGAPFEGLTPVPMRSQPLPLSIVGATVRIVGFGRVAGQPTLWLIEQSASSEARVSLRAAWHTHFEELYRRLDAEIAQLADEVTSVDDDNYVPTRLRVRALSLFRGLTAQGQTSALELIHGLIHADEMITPPERNLYEELTTYFAAIPAAGPARLTARMPAVAPGPEPTPSPVSLLIGGPLHNPLTALSDPLLDPIEHTYSPHPLERKAQVAWDYQLLQHAVAQWQRQRAEGAGRLAGISDVAQIPAGAGFLDQYVHVLRPGQPLELVVLGDLHGCYSCLKAALLQSNFVQRVWAHQWDPQRYPDAKLVLLGDYIDRGLFSFDGVLRAALHLFVSMPDHVILLRGNHEYLRYFDNRIVSGVYPAEALASIAPHVPIEMLEAYRLLFEHMPTSLVCDRTLFVHGGIPRDDLFEERYAGLSSLNDPDLRFQMMWSDPVLTDHIPIDLQRLNPRFSFGRNQFRSFMTCAGLHTMIRGHEKIDRGFEVFYALGEHRLLTLFSAGGHDNRDLPVDSSYRTVTPMALTLQYGDGAPTANPWPLHYQAFNYPPHNGLYRPHPVLEFLYL